MQLLSIWVQALLLLFQKCSEQPPAPIPKVECIASSSLNFLKAGFQANLIIYER